MRRWTDTTNTADARRVQQLTHKAITRARGSEYLYVEAMGADRTRLLQAGWEVVTSTPRSIGGALVERTTMRRHNPEANAA